MSQDHEQENNDALDAELFGMGKTAGAGEVSVEVTRSNRNKFLIYVGIVGVLSVSLVLCIGVSVGAYFFFAGRKQAAGPDDADAKTKQLGPVKEQPARIKQIHREQNAVSLIIGTGKVQTFEIGGNTKLLDADGKRLGGVADLEMHKNDDVTILMTEDRQGLRWLKLSAK